MSSFELWKLSLLIIATMLRCKDAVQIQRQRPIYNPLNGQHLRIVWPRWEGNPKDMHGPLKGGVIVDYLSTRFNFSYEMVRVTERRWDPEPTRGLLSYLLENKSDLLVDGLPPTSRRLELFDLTLPWLYDSINLLIPAPNETSANINAVIKPFQWPVWLSVGVSLASVIMVLSQLPRLLSRFRETLKMGSNKNQNWTADNRRVIKSFDSYLYVFGNLLSQGGPCRIKKIQFRVVAGVWTLAAFVLVQAYTSTLITYLVVPNNSPLINSVQDVVQRNDINLLLRKESLIDEYLNSNQTTLFRKLKERADSFPKSRCILPSECIRLISPGSKNTFANAKVYLLDVIIEDFKKTGGCNFKLVQDTISNLFVVFALQKSSPFTSTVTRGVLELQENGLTDFWDTWFRRMPSQCLENIGNGHKSKTSKPLSLSLKNLAGAFLVWLIGISLSFVSFLNEKIQVILISLQPRYL